MSPHRIQAGKNDPRILNEGALEHPAANSIAAEDAPMAAVWNTLGPAGVFNPLIMSWPFRMQQVTGLEGQGRQPSQQLCARADVGGARLGQSALR